MIRLPSTRPSVSTLQEPVLTRFTSLETCPLLSSGTRTAFAFRRYGSTTERGNGQREASCSNPARIPCFRASRTARRADRATETELELDPHVYDERLGQLGARRDERVLNAERLEDHVCLARLDS